MQDESRGMMREVSVSAGARLSELNAYVHKWIHAQG